MPGKIDRRLAELGIVLPPPPAPIASYIPASRSGNLVFISGQACSEGGKPRFVGKVGRDFTLEEGREAARLCALNIVAILRAALDGDLDKVRRCVRLGGFVNAEPDFSAQSSVINGASDLIAQIFGDDGKHARAAVGAQSLPQGIAVEVDAVFEVI